MYTEQQTVVKRLDRKNKTILSDTFCPDLIKSLPLTIQLVHFIMNVLTFDTFAHTQKTSPIPVLEIP